MNAQARVPTYPVCGIPISALTPTQAAQTIVEAATSRRPLEVHLCNAFTLSLVDSDAELRAALERGDLNLPDGSPVAWLGRRQGTSGPVRGPGLVGDVADLGVTQGLRHYLYGGKPGVAVDMAAGLARHAPGFQAAGLETPPFRPLDDQELDALADRVRASNSHILWIGLGTPRQDYIVPRLAKRLELPVVPVGAAFDFWSGAVQEAPGWIQGSGLEWLHRLAAEPRRLWRRYLIGNPKFIYSTVAHHRRYRRIRARM